MFRNDNLPGAITRRRFLQASVASTSLLTIAGRSGMAAESAPLQFAPVTCEGHYAGHLQGVCTDRQSCIYWSFTTVLVKTDARGRIISKVDAPSHQGDLCYRDGKLYVAVNLGKFNRPAGEADSWVYVFDAGTLKELDRHPVPEVVHGAGGMDTRDGRYYIVGGLPEGVNENYVYEYDEQFQFVKRHVIDSGYTLMGIQTATYHDGCWWLGCYGKPAVLLKTDADFRLLGRWNFDCSLGSAGFASGRLLVARGGKTSAGHSGSLTPAVPDEAAGLKLIQG